MQQIKIDELRVSLLELAKAYGKYGNSEDAVPHTNAVIVAQFQKLQQLANEKGKIIAFVPEGKWETFWLFSEDKMMRVEL